MSCVAAALISPVFASQDTSGASESPSEWPAQEEGNATTWAPEPPENWTYPLLVDFHARDAAYPERIPAHETNWTLKEKIGDILERRLNLSMAQQEEYDEDRQREIEELEESLERHEQEFVAEDRQKTVEVNQHRRNASASGVRGLLEAVNQNPNLNMTVIYAYNHTGKLLAVVGDLETAQWLDRHPFTGSLWPADAVPGIPGLASAGPTVAIDKVHQSGTKGAGEVFAVLDNSVRGNHIYLRQYADADCVGPTSGCDPNNEYLDNNGDHGTAVAGVINSFHDQETGEAPSGSIWDIQVAGYDPVTDETSVNTVDATEGFEFMSDQGVKYGVFSYMWAGTHGGAGSLVVYVDHFASADHNMLLGLITGNHREPVNPPCTGYNHLCVGGTNDQNDADRNNDVIWITPTRGSNYGPTADGRKKPDVVAPAASITTTDRETTSSMKTVGGGTSLAAPMVAGIAELLVDERSSLNRQQVKAIIINTAGDHIEGQWDPDWGWGYVHAENALIVAKAGYFGSHPIGHKETVNFMTAWYEAGDLVTATITWKRQTEAACCTYKPFADYNLEVRGPNGDRLDISNSAKNNVEHVSVVAAETGWYRFEAHGYNVPSDAGPLWVSHSIWPNQDVVDFYKTSSQGSTGIGGLTDQLQVHPDVLPDEIDDGALNSTVLPMASSNGTAQNPSSDDCGLAWHVSDQYYVRYDECEQRTEAWEEVNGCPGLQTSETECGPADRRLV